jgi:hypothetical protein
LNPDDAVKLFAVANQLLEHDLDRVERKYGIDLQRDHQAKLTSDETYYPQIEQEVRSEAAKMAPHYEVFYSLENTIRSLIKDSLEAAIGESWWDDPGCIPANIKTDAEDRRQKEIDSGTTPRSSEPLDFTNFGELGEIIKANWTVFGGMFSSVKAVERVMANLNTLRSPIAHCSPLAEDEVLRLQLSVRDWFRLTE